jgi:hypothetical protein
VIGAKWLTITKLRSKLRPGGCLQAKRHARAMLEVGHPLRCYVAHPPTTDDEEADAQRWFIKVPTSTRRTHALSRLPKQGRNKRSRVTDEAPVFSDPVPEAAYASTPATLPERDGGVHHTL